MKHLFFFILFSFCLGYISKAQEFKHEVQIGIHGAEVFFITHNDFESFWTYNDIAGLGYFSGLQINANFFKRFDFGIGGDYTRIFHQYAKQQLTFSAFIGFKFGGS